MSQKVAVLGWGYFVPRPDSLGRAVPDAASKPEASELPLVPGAAIVPARQRRRASVFSRSLAEAYSIALEQANGNAAEIAAVFGSALGEAATMIELLGQMWDETAMMSPMKFATSVHNAASGTVSIATENRGFTTSLGADYDTPAMSLVEGVGLVASEGRSVLVCCGDEAPPDDLVPEDVGWSLLAAAIAIAPVEGASSDAPRLAIAGPNGEDASAPILVPFEFEGSLERNPSVGLLDLALALEHGYEGQLRLDRGMGRGYSARISSGTR